MMTLMFLPMTMMSGILGMNVAGLPGLHDPNAFLWVCLPMVAAAVMTYLCLKWKQRI